METSEILEWAKLFVLIVTFLLSTGGCVFAYFRTRYTVKRDEMDDEIDGLKERVAVVETEIRHAPTQGQFERVHRDLSDLNGTMRELRGSLNGVKAGMDIIHKHLLAQTTGKGTSDG